MLRKKAKTGASQFSDTVATVNSIPESGRPELEAVSEHHRRLDSMARLLESDGTCAAVCLVDNTIIVTSNNIHALKKTEF